MPRERFRDSGDPSNLSPFDDPYAATATVPGGNVSVVHGCYSHSLPLAGMTVREARAELEERMNIDPDAMALIDGNDATEDTPLTEGQVLTFVKHAGEKGRALPFPGADLAGCSPRTVRWVVLAVSAAGFPHAPRRFAPRTGRAQRGPRALPRFVFCPSVFVIGAEPCPIDCWPKTEN